MAMMVSQNAEASALNLVAPVASPKTCAFSRLQYAGVGVAFGIGSVKQTADRERRLGLDVNYTSMTANLNGVSTLNRLQLALAYDQQRPVGQLFGRSMARRWRSSDSRKPLYQRRFG